MIVLPVIMLYFLSFASADTDDDIPIRSPSQNTLGEVLNYVKQLVKEEKDFRVEFGKKYGDIENKVQMMQTEFSSFVSEVDLHQENSTTIKEALQDMEQTILNEKRQRYLLNEQLLDILQMLEKLTKRQDNFEEVIGKHISAKIGEFIY